MKLVAELKNETGNLLIEANCAEWNKLQRSPEYHVENPLQLSFNEPGFIDWIRQQGFSKGYRLRMENCFAQYFENRTFENPVLLMNYISKTVDKNSIVKTCRNYLNYCEQAGLLSDFLLLKYRKLLSIPQSQPDVYCPSDLEVMNCYYKTLDHEGLSALYLLLGVSGCRIMTAKDFLKDFDKQRIIRKENFIYAPINARKGTKSVFSLFIPTWTYDKLHKVKNTYHALRERYKEREPDFSLKYLRKWHYNFLIYQGVPSDVADFIQGRNARSVGSMHYLSKQQQAEFWYSKIADNLKKHFFERD